MISLDAEKAFDNIDWKWLFLTLEEWGLWDRSWNSSKTCMRHLGLEQILERTYLHHSRFTRGRGRAAPLSRLLFNLAIEPLTRQILASPRIQGIPFSANLSLKLAIFADDVLFFSNSPATDIPGLEDILKNFRTMSGLKINFLKSVILKLTRVESGHWTKATPFKVTTGAISESI